MDILIAMGSYLFFRADSDLMLGLFNAFLGTSNSDDLAVVSNARDADLGCGNLFKILQLLPLLSKNPAMVLLGN